ncbi:hypothetical protein [Paludibaculum fermentans]|uniref:hypothetical protein n=1 Tax=Paludibaculum fermentans TaxID=1473598 RepID=UPI003EC01E3B
MFEIGEAAVPEITRFINNVERAKGEPGYQSLTTLSGSIGGGRPRLTGVDLAAISCARVIVKLKSLAGVPALKLLARDPELDMYQEDLIAAIRSIEATKHAQ